MNVIFQKLGISAFPIILISIGIIGIMLFSAWQIFIRKSVLRPHVTEHMINAIPVLGAVIVSLGLCQSIWGLSSMHDSIMQAGAYSPGNGGVLMGGISFALMSFFWGLLLFSVYSMVWFVLKTQFRRLMDAANQ